MAGLGMMGSSGRPRLGPMPERAVQVCRDALRAVLRAAPEYLRPIEQHFGVKLEERIENDGYWR